MALDFYGWSQVFINPHPGSHSLTNHQSIKFTTSRPARIHPPRWVREENAEGFGSQKAQPDAEPDSKDALRLRGGEMNQRIMDRDDGDVMTGDDPQRGRMNQSHPVIIKQLIRARGRPRRLLPQETQNVA